MIFEKNKYVRLTFEEEEIDTFSDILKKLKKESQKAGFKRTYEEKEIDMIHGIHKVFNQKTDKSPDES